MNVIVLAIKACEKNLHVVQLYKIQTLQVTFKD